MLYFYHLVFLTHLNKILFLFILFSFFHSIIIRKIKYYYLFKTKRKKMKFKKNELSLKLNNKKLSWKINAF